MPKHKKGTKKQQQRYERIVQALKREGVVQNPYAVANSKVYGDGHKKKRKN